MTAFLALALLVAPGAAREPVGGADFERIEDPLEHRVASLLAGEPVFLGIAAVVPLYARVPSEAGHGRPGDLAWAKDGLRARFLVEDGRCYLRVVNPAKEPVLLAAGTVFALGAAEVAVARDAVVPGDYAALVPAAPLGPVEDPAAELDLAAALPPRATGSLLAGLPAFDAAVARARALLGEERYLPVLRMGPVVARREGLLSLLEPVCRGFGGTAVGAVFLVGDRPAAAHVFARHDLFLEALPDLAQGIAVEIHDEEMRGVAAGPAADARSRALAWLRGVARIRAGWSESYGAGFETLGTSAAPQAVLHAVVDPQGALLHAGFHAIPALPAAGEGGAVGPVQPPRPPDRPDETPTGFRERRPRPTVEDERRDDLNPNPGPHGGTPQGPAPGGAAGGPGAPGAGAGGTGTPPRDDPAPPRQR